MPRWIYAEAFASLPECAGHLPLSIAFAQFVAVEVGVDPLDRIGLEAELRGATEAQNFLRWHVRLLQDGQLRSVRRQLGGGLVEAIPASHWGVDDPVDRFITSQYCHSDPFNSLAVPDSWIFVSDDDFQRLWDAMKAQVMAAYDLSAPPVRSKKQQHSVANDREPAVRTSSGSAMMMLPEVEHVVGLRKSMIYKLIASESFPAQVKVGGKSLWRRKDIEQWVEGLSSPVKGPPRT